MSAPQFRDLEAHYSKYNMAAKDFQSGNEDSKKLPTGTKSVHKGPLLSLYADSIHNAALWDPHLSKDWDMEKPSKECISRIKRYDGYYWHIMRHIPRARGRARAEADDEAEPAAVPVAEQSQISRRTDGAREASGRGF